MCGRELLYKHSGDRDGCKTDMRTLVLVFVCIVGSVLVCVGVWQVLGTHVHSVHISVHTEKILGKVDEKFLSLTLDTSTIQTGWLHRHIRSKKLLRLAALLAPAYLRVGGTQADRLVFEPHSEPEPEEDVPLDGGACAYEEQGCQHQNVTFFNMSGAEWRALNHFVREAGLHLLFDLNVLLRNGSRWDDSNARLLLEHSDKEGFSLDWQLGNEPNAFRHVFGEHVVGRTLGHNFVALRKLLDTFPRYKKSLLVGPDVTRPKRRGILQDQPLPYLEKFLMVANQSISAISWHQYYVDGRKAKLSDFVKPAVLDMLSWEISAVKEAVSGVPLPMWLTETGSAYGGGAPKLSDRFVAGFMWLDKLGLAAQKGITVVMRQSLAQGYYALVDSDMEPSPDWWLSILYKRLVGRGVLSVSGAPDYVRIYSHCARQHSAVTLFGMNLSNLPSLVTVSGLPPASSVLTFILTCDTILTSQHVLLNGDKLVLSPDGSLPPFIPVRTTLEEPLHIPPFSMAFWVVQNVDVPVCTT